MTNQTLAVDQDFKLSVHAAVETATNWRVTTTSVVICRDAEHLTRLAIIGHQVFLLAPPSYYYYYSTIVQIGTVRRYAT